MFLVEYRLHSLTELAKMKYLPSEISSLAIRGRYDDVCLLPQAEVEAFEISDCFIPGIVSLE